MKLSTFTGLSLKILAAGLFTVSAQAALYDRGNGMIYDDVLDITWLQDANYAQTSGYASGGRMTWANANTWAANLSYGGFDDWRLASANLINGASPCFDYDGSCDRGYNNTTGELGHMFYNNLGNLGSKDINGVIQAGGGVTRSHFVDGGSGENVIYGGEGRDYLFASGGQQEIYGYGGNDSLFVNEPFSENGEGRSTGSHLLDGGDGDDYSLDASPSNGTVTEVSDGVFEYIPTVDFSGSDSFTYKITDSNGDQAIFTDVFDCFFIICFRWPIIFVILTVLS